MLVTLGVYTVRQNSAHQATVAVADDKPARAQKRAAEALADEARETLAHFLAARTWEQKLPYVVNASSMAAQMRDYYKTHALEQGVAAGEFESCPALVSASDVEHHVTTLSRASTTSFSFSDNKTTGVDAAALYFFRNGKLDWETFVQQYTGRLAEFLKSEQPGSAIFRVVLDRTEPAAGQGLPSLNISNPNTTPQPLTHLAVRSLPEPVAQAISALDVGQCRLATVELEWSDDATPVLQLKRLLSWESQGVVDSTL
jgi:hypothetical protein